MVRGWLGGKAVTIYGGGTEIRTTSSPSACSPPAFDRQQAETPPAVLSEEQTIQRAIPREWVKDRRRGCRRCALRDSGRDLGTTRPLLEMAAMAGPGSWCRAVAGEFGDRSLGLVLETGRTLVAFRSSARRWRGERADCWAALVAQKKPGCRRRLRRSGWRRWRSRKARVTTTPSIPPSRRAARGQELHADRRQSFVPATRQCLHRAARSSGASRARRRRAWSSSRRAPKA